MLRRIMLFAVVLAVAVTAVPAKATVIPLFATLDGAQEAPPVPTPGFGAAALLFDTDTNLLVWSIVFGGLLAPTTVSHFHNGLPGVSGPVVLDINVGAPGFSSPLFGDATLTAGQAAQLLAGNWYINIHTTLNPGGEIRGQVTVIPEPATVTLLGLGSALLFASRRLRRKFSA